VSDTDVHVVLDTSAIAAFATGSVSVGEILTEVERAGGRVGIPVLCLAAAEYALDRDALVVWRMLINHPAVNVLSLEGRDVDPVALTRTAGGLLDGAVAHFATALDADVLTAERDRYADLLPSDQVLSIDLEADDR
jgi:hypothetical protein